MFLRLLLVMVISFSSVFAYVKQYGVEEKGYKFSDYSESEQQSIALGFMLETFLDLSISSKKKFSTEKGSGIGDYIAFVGLPKKMYEYNILDVKQNVKESDYAKLLTTYNQLLEQMKSMKEAQSYSNNDLLLFNELRKMVVNNNNCLLSRGNNCADNNILITVMKGGG